MEIKYFFCLKNIIMCFGERKKLVWILDLLGKNYDFGFFILFFWILVFLGVKLFIILFIVVGIYEENNLYELFDFIWNMVKLS